MGGNKGSVLDLIFISVIIFIFALMIIFSRVIRDALIPNLKNLNLLNSPDSISILDSVDVFMGSMDLVFVSIAVLSGISIVILASRMNTEPTFFFFALIILAVSIILAGIFRTSILKVASNPAMASAAGNFPIMSAFFDNYITFIAIIGILVVAVLYAKIVSKRGDEGGEGFEG